VNKKNRERVYKQLIEDEGIKYEIYLDHLGYPTFGIGHLILETDEEYGKPVGTPVNKERVYKCFEEELDLCISECHKLYGKDTFKEFPSEVQEILVNMMFNLGRPRLSGFKKFNAALLKGNWQTAAKEGRDSRWYRQVTNRAERLMTRLETL